MASLPVIPDPPAVWHNQSAEDVLERLGSTIAGLSAAEAARRLTANGPNELKAGQPVNLLGLFAGQFKSLLIWILIAAGLISGLLGERIDSIAILVIVVLNAIIGFYQEFKAEKSIAALKKLTAPQAKVRRDGRVISIPAAAVVLGDILWLESGDLVAADARLLETASLKCVESALTGESEAVAKQATRLELLNLPLGDRENMLFMGTSVVAGTGTAVVVATAMNTELGRIAGLVEESGTKEATPLQKKLDAFGRVLGWVTLGIVLVLFGLGLLRGTKIFEMFMTSVSLAVAAVPEGLPAVVTIALSIGVVRMARRRTLVRNLPAVETLGSTTVICTDKTGTLTVGEMTVRALYVAGQYYEVTGEGYGPLGEVRCHDHSADGEHAVPLLELATVLLGCNHAHLVQEGETWKVIGDPTEGALLVAGIKASGDRERIERELPKQHELPFDSDRKRSTVIRRIPDGVFLANVIGAPEMLLQRSTHFCSRDGVRPLTDHDRREILTQNAALAQKALRVLGAAYRDLGAVLPEDLSADNLERDLVFVGLAGMYDPPRPEAKDAVAKCRAAGIRVVMITGDHPHTAAAIAHELGIAAADDGTIAGPELDDLTDEELRHRVPSITVYARVSAEHKLRIIRAWKANDAVVAMTGDGVNDAPAIKHSDIGIAMGRSGTEVTKQVADMIVTDDNFKSIVDAVEEGRGIFDNIQRVVYYLLSCNASEVLLMFFASLVGWPVPLAAIQLLWINLVTDGLPALAMAVEPLQPDIMRRKPRPPRAPVISRGDGLRIFGNGFLLTAVAAAGFWIVYQGNEDSLVRARTVAFGIAVYVQLFLSLACRSRRHTMPELGLFSNPLLVGAIAVSGLLQVGVMTLPLAERVFATVPLTWEWLLIVGLALTPVTIVEVSKLFRGFARRSK